MTDPIMESSFKKTDYIQFIVTLLASKQNSWQNFSCAWQTAASLFPFSWVTFLFIFHNRALVLQSSWSKGISEMKLKQQSPCSNCMHRPVTSWGNTWMHLPVTSQADACTYCMGSKVSSFSRIYLYTSYFVGAQSIFHSCLLLFTLSWRRLMFGLSKSSTGKSEKFSFRNFAASTWGRSYKTFYNRNLRNSIIS
jgi:hypothetical protein